VVVLGVVLPELHTAAIRFARRLRSGEAEDVREETPYIDYSLAPAALAAAKLLATVRTTTPGQEDEVEDEAIVDEGLVVS
jgi:hypothetical protein